jgi:hypothetical protein
MLLLTMVLLVVLLLQATNGAPIATILLTTLAGALTAPITQMLKNTIVWEGRKALLLTVAVSIALGLFVGGIAYYTGEARSFADFINIAPWVFSEATILYKMVKPAGTPDAS